MNEAPWWLAPAVTVAGVLLAQLVVVWLYFAKQRAEDKRRWHEQRLHLYADFISAQLELTFALGGVSTLATDEHFDLRAKMMRLRELLGRIEILASHDVFARAADLTWLTSRGATERQPVDESANELKDALVKAIRQELGIESPPRAPSSRGLFG